MSGEQERHQAMRLADQQRVDLDALIRGGQHRVTEVHVAVVYDRAEMRRKPFSSGPVATLAVDNVKRHGAMKPPYRGLPDLRPPVLAFRPRRAYCSGRRLRR